MVKVVNCPICEKGKLNIFIFKDYEICFSGKISEMFNRVYCTNCKRQIKYKVIKK